MSGPDSAGHSFYARDVRFARGAGPTVTPEPTEPVVTCREVIVNGDFEQGPQVGWKLASNLIDSDTGDPIAIDEIILHNDAWPTTDPVYQGDWMAWYPAVVGSQVLLYQYQPLAGFEPSRIVSSTLGWALGIGSLETPDGEHDDTFKVVLVDEQPDGSVQYLNVSTPLSEETQDNQTWREYQLQMPDSFWQTVAAGEYHLGFLMENDDVAGTETAYGHDVTSFEVCESRSAAMGGQWRVDGAGPGWLKGASETSEAGLGAPGVVPQKHAAQPSVVPMRVAPRPAPARPWLSGTRPQLQLPSSDRAGRWRVVEGALREARATHRVLGSDVNRLPAPLRVAEDRLPTY
jgi:hypothetical protein